ncbi:MAG: methyl-accepting chemotaxis protein [Myxococcota bacterium]
MFFRRLERRFEALRDYSTKLEAGQLDAPAPALGADEIGELTHALARLSAGLGGSISNVRSATRGLDELSGSVRDASRKIAGDAGTQSLSLESTSRAMTQLAEGSGEVDRTLSNLIESAERSHREMSEVASEVRAIANIVEELAAAVHQSQVGFGATERNLQQAESAIRMLTSTAESTAASMNQMAASIASVEDGTENASRRATATATSAAMGAHIGRETVAAVSEIERNTEATVDSVRFLSDRLESIDQILAVIDDIANQTKLLSLNASIIAAQAGEHGAGFLVVADQIKALSLKTAGSTREIAEVVREVRRRSGNTIEVSESSLRVVKREAERIGESSDTLAQIENYARDLGELIQGIDRAMKEQALGADSVNAAMQDVHATASTVGALVKEQMDSGRQLRSSMARVAELLDQTLATTNEKAAKANSATVAMMTMYEQLAAVRKANEAQTDYRGEVKRSVATLEQLSTRNRESARVLVSAVEEAISRIESLGEAVDDIESS